MIMMRFELINRILKDKKLGKYDQLDISVIIGTQQANFLNNIC